MPILYFCTSSGERSQVLSDIIFTIFSPVHINFSVTISKKSLFCKDDAVLRLYRCGSPEKALRAEGFSDGLVKDRFMIIQHMSALGKTADKISYLNGIPLEDVQEIQAKFDK